MSHIVRVFFLKVVWKPPYCDQLPIESFTKHIFGQMLQNLKILKQ